MSERRCRRSGNSRLDLPCDLAALRQRPSRNAPCCMVGMGKPASGFFGFFRRLGGPAAPPAPRPKRAPLPVRVSVMEDDDWDDEPTVGGGASVRHIRCEPAAEGDAP